MVTKIKLAGIPIIATSMDRAIELVFNSTTGAPSSFHLLNAYSISIAHNHPHYRKVLADGMNFPDGKPLATFAKFISKSASQIRGPALFERVLSEQNHNEVSHFFLGGSEELLDSLVAKVKTINPGIRIAGIYSPPFRTMSQQEIDIQDDVIVKAQPSIVWVGLGTPKQDFEASRIATHLKVTTVAVGAAFDFLSGSKRQAPDWMSKSGFEWLYRLVTEPKRLWRRYLIGNFIFLWSILFRQSK